MAVAILTIAGTWFGVFSVYLFAAHQLPLYRPSLAKKLFSKPLGALAISVAFVGLFAAWLSDDVTLRAYQVLDLPNRGIADSNVQLASLFLTTLIAIPVAATYYRLTDAAARIDADREEEKYYPWLGMLMVIVGAIFLTAAALLSIPTT